jgi:hypothetical protein
MLERGLTVHIYHRTGWAGMGLTKLIADLDSHLDAGEKEREALRNLLLSNKISQSTFDLVEKRINYKTSLVTDLKEALVAEEDYWQKSLSDATRILELLLVEFEHKHLLGRIGEEELTHKNTIINLGLKTLTNQETSENIMIQEPAQPLQTTLEQHAIQEITTKQETEETPFTPTVLNEEKEDIKPIQAKRTSNNGHASNKRKRPLTKEPPELDSSVGSIVHCMNPWKPECRSTDIELSIYYKGRSTPICRKCWEDISDKNIEWSSL